MNESGIRPEGEPPAEIPIPNHANKQVEVEDWVACFDFLYYSGIYIVRLSFPLLLLVFHLYLFLFRTFISSFFLPFLFAEHFDSTTLTSFIHRIGNGGSQTRQLGISSGDG